MSNLNPDALSTPLETESLQRKITEALQQPVPTILGLASAFLGFQFERRAGAKKKLGAKLAEVDQVIANYPFEINQANQDLSSRVTAARLDDVEGMKKAILQHRANLDRLNDTYNNARAGVPLLNAEMQDLSNAIGKHTGLEGALHHLAAEENIDVPLDGDVAQFILAKLFGQSNELTSPAAQSPNFFESSLKSVIDAGTRRDPELPESRERYVIEVPRRGRRPKSGTDEKSVHLPISKIYEQYGIDAEQAPNPKGVGGSLTAFMNRNDIQLDPDLRQDQLLDIIEGKTKKESLEDYPALKKLREIAERTREARFEQNKKIEIPQEVIPAVKPPVAGRMEEQEIGTRKKPSVFVKADSALASAFEFKGKRVDPINRIWNANNPGKLASAALGKSRKRTRADEHRLKIERDQVMDNLSRDIEKLITSAKANGITNLGQLISSPDVDLPETMLFTLQKATPVLARPGFTVSLNQVGIDALRRIPHMVETHAGKKVATMKDFLEALIKEDK